jgi:hypothetical protein
MEDQTHDFEENRELFRQIELLCQTRSAFGRFEESEQRKCDTMKSWLQRLKCRPWVQRLQRWHDKSEPGVRSAAVVSLVALTFGRQDSVPFWISLCLFPVMNPIFAKSIFAGQVVPFFYDREQEYTIEEAEACTASLYAFSGYVGWLFGLQLLKWSLDIAFFFWEHPFFACTLFSCKFLIYRHKPWLEYCRTKTDVLLYVTTQWMGNSYNRIRVCVWKCTE